MISDALKTARLESATRDRETNAALAAQLLKNPVVEFALGMLLIAIMEEIELKKDSGNHILEGPEALIARGWVAVMIICQQLGPEAITEMVKAVVPNMSGGIQSMLPLLLAAPK